MPGSVWAMTSAITDHGEIGGLGADLADDGDRAITWIPTKGR
jgi:hypothetical protein